MKLFRTILSLCIAMAFTVPAPAFAGVAENGEHVHEWSSWDIEEEPTCDSEGYRTRYCEVCGDFEEETMAVLPHKWSEWEKVISHSRNNMPKCVQERTCEYCGEWQERALPIELHDWSNWKTVRKATPFKEGKKTRECYDCWKTQSKPIAKRAITSSEKKAKEAVSKYLKYAKAYKVSNMTSCFAKKSDKYGYPTRKATSKIFKKYNKKMMSWTFVDVKAAGKKVTATVKVKHPDFYSPIYNATKKYHGALYNWGAKHPYASNSQIQQRVNKEVKVWLRDMDSRMKNCKKRSTTETVKFTMVKAKGKWKIEKRTRSVVDIATGCYNQATNDAYHEYFA